VATPLRGNAEAGVLRRPRRRGLRAVRAWVDPACGSASSGPATLGRMRGLGPLFGLLPVVSTLLGGLLAIRLRARLPGLMALTGGVVLGVALFEVAPEAVARLGEGSGGARLVGIAMGAGFLGFLVLSRLLVLHHRDDPETAVSHAPVGAVGAAALSIHSLVDGFGIGAGFAISPTLGVFVLVAVVAHDLADGINTVTFVLAQDGDVARARRWLVLDAVAPEAGALIGAAVTLSDYAFGWVLGVYGGVFVMIGVGELLAEAHRESSVSRLALTVAGAALMLGVSLLVPG
jgi:zinc transporter, ZIP family